jgi:hypothetical protein
MKREVGLQYFVKAVSQETFDQALDEVRRQYEAGRGESLLEAISLCADRNCPLPEWAAIGFDKALLAFKTGNAVTVDEAFGIRPRQTPKGRRTWSLHMDVGVLLTELWESWGLSKDEAKGRLAQEFELSESTVRDLYAKYEREYLALDMGKTPDAIWRLFNSWKFRKSRQKIE